MSLRYCKQRLLHSITTTQLFPATVSHKADKCENKKEDGERAEITCYSCGEIGHKATNCQTKAN